MIRTFNEQYPSLQEKQADFRKALISIVNARKYLESEGFKDFEIKCASGYIEGTILRSDGAELGCKAFFESQNRTKLLEVMVSEEVSFRRPSFMNYYPDGGIVKSLLGKRGYSIHLSVEDTTKSFNPLTWFSSAKRFAFYYEISFEKELIENPDNEEFERYIEGLRDASRKDTLSKPRSEVSSKEIPHQPSSFINPWDIDIPKIENATQNRGDGER